MHIKASRYGVELAYMLLTTSFYQHNERVDAHSSKRKCKLILEHSEWLDKTPILNELFGLMPNCEESITVTVESSSSNSAVENLYFNKASIMTSLEGLHLQEVFKLVPYNYQQVMFHCRNSKLMMKFCKYLSKIIILLYFCEPLAGFLSILLFLSTLLQQLCHVQKYHL